jgi:hypothetical protein
MAAEPRITSSFDAVIGAYKRDIDRSLVRHTLRLTVEERVRQLMSLQQVAEALRAGMMHATRRP